jgi:hypothetical protein
MAKKWKKKTHLDEIDLGETVIIARSLDVED